MQKENSLFVEWWGDGNGVIRRFCDRWQIRGLNLFELGKNYQIVLLYISSTICEHKLLLIKHYWIKMMLISTGAHASGAFYHHLFISILYGRFFISIHPYRVVMNAHTYVECVCLLSTWVGIAYIMREETNEAEGIIIINF